MKDANEINRILGDSIIAIRKKHNLTQEEIAEKLDVTRQAVSRWEMGLSAPNIYTLSMISELFQTSVSELLKEDSGFKDMEYEKVPDAATLVADKKKKTISFSDVFSVAGLIGGIVIFLILPVMTQKKQNMDRILYNSFYTKSYYYLTEYPYSVWLVIAIVLIVISTVLFYKKHRMHVH